MRLAHFALWLAACICLLLAALGNTLGRRNLVAAGLLLASTNFLITAAQALN